ncbi:uncharacterized protein LOC129905966 [Episyrphus balteatus]|uniref:uncharacterized protein LOC129905966 n=1 Tax=Episyrphus balteatus TaxID=286459 RepID=UPI0024854A59|nr:uncharacterized protein LOC129905966 [Episyrphus balteatus]
MSNELRIASRRCIVMANHQRNNEVALLKRSRLEMFEEVQRFKDSVSNCTTSSNHLPYSECLNNVIRIDREIVDRISSRFDSSTERERRIEDEKQNCIRRAVSRSQDKTSGAFRNLESCLSNVRNYK